MASRPDPKKRPSGSRPLQGRVFSDSSSLRSVLSDFPIERHASEPIGPQSDEETANYSGQTGWTGVRLVDSPKPEGRPFSPPPGPSSSSGNYMTTTTKRSKPRPLKKASLSGSIASDETPTSPSLRRWETLRKAVMPPAGGSPTEASPTTTAPPAQATLPPRPSTPKQFRLPRIGFKQVVEQAQEVSADQSRAFGDDILRACLIARQGEQRVLKRDRDAPAPTTTFNRTFMSTVTSIPGSAASSTTNLPQARFGLRRPPSLQSVPTATGLPPSSSLSTVISHYASAPSDGPRPSQDALPYETEVLSVLLMPFLDSSVTPDVEKRRLESIETFETIVKTWPSVSNEAELQRCFWCCKAAHPPTVPKMVRLRLLGVLSSGLFAPGVTFRADSPFVLQTVLQALFSLQAALSSQPNTHEEVDYVRELIVGAMHGACGDLEPSLVKTDYGVDASHDDDGLIKECVVAQALSACLELDAKSSKPTIVQYMAEDFWRVSTRERVLPARLIPLFSRVVGRLAQSILDFLPPLDSPLRPGQAYATRQLFQNHLVPQANILDDAEAPECRSFVAQIALRMLCMDDARLVQDPPSYPFQPLTKLLATLSQLHPQQFYKPLFACAAATKDATIVHHLQLIAVLARFYPDFWTSDVEMLLVVFMSVGNSPIAPRKVRMRQLVLLTEFIAHVQSVAQEPRGQVRCTSILTAKARFFFALEHKVGAALSAMEKSATLPESQRILLTVLFLQVRLFVRSLKAALWLPRVIAWTTRQDIQDSPSQTDETATEIAKLSWFYTEAQEASHATSKARNGSKSIPTRSEPGGSAANNDDNTDPSSFLQRRGQLLDVFRKGIVYNCLQLLVAVSGLLTGDEFNSLDPFLWRGCLSGPTSEVHAPATFLIMQSMEKTPRMAELIREDLTSPQAIIRRQGARRMSLLAGWRFQLLSQKFITDKVHRRPFKLARAPNAFMATDIGSSTFIVEEKLDAIKAANGTVIPLELRKRLADIGWHLDDQAIDQKEELIRTPLSLLPGIQMDRQDSMGTSPAPPISRSPSGEDLSLALLPAASSHSPVKRRPIFVPPLASLLSDLAHLAGDPDFSVASAARSAILDLMKEDPALLTRPALDALTEGGESIQHAVSVLRSFLHVQHPLPPAMAHHLFNNITGFLKMSSRRENSPLSAFAHTIPLLSDLSTQVSTMSIRDIRRAKVESILVPSGSFWFTPSAPVGAMFPRSLYEAAGSKWANAREHLSNMTMIRVAQNILFLNMLRRNPQDVQAIRKNMTRLVLPSYRDIGERPQTDLHAFVARKASSSPDSLPDAELSGQSLLLSRSYVLLVAEVFKSLPRHLNDRNELAVLMDGLNQVLIAHGDDIGMVAHVLIALMIASTRFRRIFMSSGGYTLFMPAVMKVYAENEANIGIRAAIQYATNRFYALHEEAFVFQSFDILSYMMTFADLDKEWMSEHIHSLFLSLKDNAPLTAHDYAGIHGANRAEERDAILVNTAEEKPQALFSLLRRGNGVNGPRVEIAVPERQEANLLPDNMVRLFLTVIGHDPSIRRAEYFLRLLRYMAPHLYNASQAAQSILGDGIEALGLIFISRSTAKNAKVPEAAQLRTGLDDSRTVFSEADNLANDFVGMSRAPSDLAEMRLEYLSLVAAFTGSGGSHLPEITRRVMDVVKIVMNNSDDIINQRVATFMSTYSRSLLIRAQPLRQKHITNVFEEIVPVYKAYASILDFTGVLTVLAELAEMPTNANNPVFSRHIVNDFCVRGLEACDFVASEGMVSTLAFRPALVKLLCRAILLQDVDIMGVLERQPITYDFLAGVLLPFSLAMPSTQDISRDARWTERWRKEAPARAWARLLLMIMTKCGKTTKTSASGPAHLERSNSKDKHDSTPKSEAATLLPIYMQIVKVIVLRAENDISSKLPGIWAELGLFIKSVLAGGDAAFALQAHDASAPPSPTLSPLTPRSQSMDDFNPFLGGSRTSSPTKTRFPQPRIVDYLLWSMLEFACLHRSPLLIQLRLIMQVNAATLDQELRRQQAPSPRSRLSVFSKPRRLSGYYSGGPTPEGSPLLRPMPSADFPHTPQKDDRLPGYARFASPLASTDDLPGAGARIVHLGPVRSPDAFFRAPVSPGGSRTEMHPHARMWQAARSATVQSAVLVRETYRRIRVVQQAMGYANPLPLLPGEREEDAGEAKAWTRVEALRAVTAETEELMEEFGQRYSLVGEDTVIIDPDESLG
ncbi:hypothetical protein OF83DRAFT_1055215 [Amylostereum chailletii]|nr:hypothetical protein OF83DRAFT_1055215 [Amylostereum chailletii]